MQLVYNLFFLINDEYVKLYKYIYISKMHSQMDSLPFCERVIICLIIFYWTFNLFLGW